MRGILVAAMVLLSGCERSPIVGHPPMTVQPSPATPSVAIDSAARNLLTQFGRPKAGNDRLNVGVVPFTDLTGQHGQLVPSLNDAIITRLAQRDDFQIVALPNSDSFDRILAELKRQARMGEAGIAEAATLAKAGKFLSAEALLIGSISNSGRAVKISCQLYDCRTGGIIPGMAGVAEIEKSSLSSFYDK